MAGGDDGKIEALHGFDGLRDYALIRSGEMQAAKNRVQRFAGK